LLAEYLNEERPREKILFFHGDGGNGIYLLKRNLTEDQVHLDPPLPPLKKGGFEMFPPFDPPPAPLKKGGARGIFFCSRGARGGSDLTYC
jgi:hypothetical protein